MLMPEEGIDILVDMAKTGDIDPWNVDIVAVANHYLKIVAERDHSDLRVTGKTLLFLAILLRMKSDLLAGFDPFQEDAFDMSMEPSLMEDMEGLPLQTVDFSMLRKMTGRYKTLDEVIRRKTSYKEPRVRPVTLDDLIRELKKYEQLEKERLLHEKVEKSDRRRMVDYGNFTSDDIEDMAHDESLEESIERLENSFLQLVSEDFPEVSLSDLEHHAGIDRVSAFLATLFLESQAILETVQDTFYAEELYVRRVPTATAKPDTVLATV
jgi:segregation and condensation protein A